MKYKQTLLFLVSLACCATLGCERNEPASSTPDNSGSKAMRSPVSDEAGTLAPAGNSGSAQAADAAGQDERPSAPPAISTGSDQQQDKKPNQPVQAGGVGRQSLATDVAPSLETERPSGSTSEPVADAELPTEVRETFFPNGATRRQWLVKVLPDGTEVEHGEALLWYDNGQVKLQGEYVDGVREGLWLSWHSNGKNRGEGRLHRNRRFGTWIMWDENGQKRSEATYEVGLKHGRATVWDADGKVVSTGEYVRKKKHGIWVTYVDGEKTETEWVKGVKVE